MALIPVGLADDAGDTKPRGGLAGPGLTASPPRHTKRRRSTCQRPFRLPVLYCPMP